MLLQSAKVLIHYDEKKELVLDGNADAVSRLQIATTLSDPPVLSEVVHLIEHFDGITVTSQHIKS